jgi:hypothetical protein
MDIRRPKIQTQNMLKRRTQRKLVGREACRFAAVVSSGLFSPSASNVRYRLPTPIRLRSPAYARAPITSLGFTLTTPAYTHRLHTSTTYMHNQSQTLAQSLTIITRMEFILDFHAACTTGCSRFITGIARAEAETRTLLGYSGILGRQANVSKCVCCSRMTLQTREYTTEYYISSTAEHNTHHPQFRGRR